MAFVDRLHHHVNTAGKVVAVAHTAYQVGKGIYHFAQVAAPFVAGAAALLSYDGLELDARCIQFQTIIQTIIAAAL